MVCLFVTSASGQELQLEALPSSAPADDVATAIHGRLAATGVAVKQGSSRTLCEIWLCKELAIVPGFQPSSTLLYPFQPGQLLGVVRFRRRSNDFRDQQINRGTYTMRFALQPVDGNHVGTSPTRDFILLVRAEDDTMEGPMEVQALTEASAAAAESPHPCMLSLRPATDAAATGIRHDEVNDWWIARLVANGTKGGESVELPLDVVVSGQGNE